MRGTLPWGAKALEKDLQSKLHQSRVARTDDGPKCRAAVLAVGAGNKSCVRLKQIHVIRYIERFRAELHVPSFMNSRVFDDRKIYIDRAWSAYIGKRARGITDRESRLVEELRGIKPLGTRRVRKLGALTSRIRPVGEEVTSPTHY